MPQDNAESPTVETTLRVRYAETDQMGVAHHANYLIWFELARSAFCRARGIDYAAMESEGLFLPVVEATCRYRAAARYDDELRIAIQPARVRRSSIEFHYRVLRGEVLIAEGETVQMLVSRDGKPRTLPAQIRDRFGACHEP